jgi:Mg2+/citrate symporter
MNTQLLLGVWAAICAAYVTVALMRWNLGKREDDHLHFADSEQQLVTAQSSIAHKLDVLDRWKAALLMLTIVSGLIIGALHVYFVWQATTSTVRTS